jgi:hypothetical protein
MAAEPPALLRRALLVAGGGGCFDARLPPESFRAALRAFSANLGGLERRAVRQHVGAFVYEATFAPEGVPIGARAWRARAHSALHDPARGLLWLVEERADVPAHALPVEEPDDERALTTVEFALPGGATVRFECDARDVSVEEPCGPAADAADPSAAASPGFREALRLLLLLLLRGDGGAGQAHGHPASQPQRQLAHHRARLALRGGQ